MLAGTVHAEWTKLRTVPSTAWLLLALVVSTVLASAGAVAAVDTDLCPSPADCPADLPELSLTGVWLGQGVAAVLGVLAMTSEYGTRMISITLAANPRRVAVLLTKAGLVAALVLGAGLLAVAGSLAAGLLILPGRGFTEASGFPVLSLADGPALRAGGGTVLYFGLIGLLGIGVGAVVRDTAGAVATMMGLLYLFPIAASFMSDPQWHEWTERLGPSTAGLHIQATVGLAELPIGPWAGLGVLAGWAAAALALGTVLFTTRDA